MMDNNCPICRYDIEHCQCRYGGNAHPEWFDRKSTSSGFMIYWGLKLKEVV